MITHRGYFINSSNFFEKSNQIISLSPFEIIPRSRRVRASSVFKIVATDSSMADFSRLLRWKHVITRVPEIYSLINVWGIMG